MTYAINTSPAPKLTVDLPLEEASQALKKRGLMIRMFLRIRKALPTRARYRQDIGLNSPDYDAKNETVALMIRHNTYF